MSSRPNRVVDFLTSRIVVRSAFLAFFVFASVQLVLFFKWARGVGSYVPRPEAVAGLLPVGHFTSFFAWVRGGGWDVLLPAGLVIIIGAVTLSVLFKRGFCGWICPVGTVWELGNLLGMNLGTSVRLPKWLDRVGRGIRYSLSAMILFWLFMVPLDQAVAFRNIPYMWVADIKIITGFGNPMFMIAIGAAFILSMLFSPVWCRYLCPLGGWYSVLGMASPLAVHRSEEACTHCHRCTRVCHARVDVEAVPNRVWAPECDGCMDCVKVCPAKGALEAKVAGTWKISPRMWAVAVVVVWLLIFGVAKVTHNWDSTIPADQFKAAINSGVLEQSSMPEK